MQKKPQNPSTGYLPVRPELSGAHLPDCPTLLSHGRTARDMTDDTHKANLKIPVAADRFWRALEHKIKNHSPLAIGRTVQKKPVRWLAWAYIAWQTDRLNRNKISPSTLRKAMTLLRALHPGGSLELIGATEVRRAARVAQTATEAAGSSPGALIQLTDLSGFLKRMGWYDGDGFLSMPTLQRLFELRSGLSQSDRHRIPKWPSADDVAAMLAACRDERDIRILSLMAWQGVRYGEALALDWSDVRFDAEGAWLHIRATVTPGNVKQLHRKNRKSYHTRARPVVLSWLLAVPEADRDGQVVGGARYARSTAPGFKAAIAAGDIGSPHNLRRHFVRRLWDAGVSLDEIARQIGDTPDVVRTTYLPTELPPAASAEVVLI